MSECEHKRLRHSYTTVYGQDAHIGRCLACDKMSLPMSSWGAVRIWFGRSPVKKTCLYVVDIKTGMGSECGEFLASHGAKYCPYCGKKLELKP